MQIKLNKTNKLSKPLNDFGKSFSVNLKGSGSLFSFMSL
ncbi:hypothetical protein GARC_3858 [Paraglaciecola arctica BSs20135]|uniref:Uncharacterized protein n=1 Tax=Paraglaciecola arctica BSs20135 TaxID=493475 RepID=K6YA73_9ALTE|nr:hypothetical protein GARC_3858 [Paraglaciecola arctica BSs20135]